MPTEQTANTLLMTPLIPYLLIFLIFYFLIIKPQRDKQREHKQLLAALKKNDEVVTAGGIHGTVINVKETTVVIRIDDNVKMEVDREAITSVVKKGNQ